MSEEKEENLKVFQMRINQVDNDTFVFGEMGGDALGALFLSEGIKQHVDTEEKQKKFVLAVAEVFIKGIHGLDIAEDIKRVADAPEEIIEMIEKQINKTKEN